MNDEKRQNENKTMKRNEYRDALFRLLALEYNCTPEDFEKSENILTLSALREGRRMYTREKYFFHMVTTGRNAVVTADACLHPFLSNYIRDKEGHWLFEIPNLLPLEKELNAHHYTLTQTYHMFLPYEKPKIGKEFAVRWYYGEELHRFYGDSRFPNAICEKYLPHRPDRMVAAAFDGDTLLGIAGCSEDAPHWMQIGVDVLPEYRSRGVGTYLVSRLREKIEADGHIPFYGTSVSNYHSWNIALRCGFRPAWVEIGASPV